MVPASPVRGLPIEAGDDVVHRLAAAAERKAWPSAAASSALVTLQGVAGRASFELSRSLGTHQTADDEERAIQSGVIRRSYRLFSQSTEPTGRSYSGAHLIRRDSTALANYPPNHERGIAGRF